MKFLTGIHILSLIGCTNITDDSVKLLTGLHTLDLSECINITDEFVKLLRRDIVDLPKPSHGMAVLR